MTVRAAVIGLGDISALHLDAIAGLADAELVAVCDIDAERAQTAAARLGVAAFTDHRSLLAAAKPDVVHICTPHSEHAVAVVDALDAGVDVIVEKPVARDPQQAAAVEDAAARSSAKIAVCFQNRYNTPVRAAKEMLDSGELGAITGAAGTVIWHRTPEYYQASPWRGTWAGGGGGLLMNQAIHTLDLLRWLVGPVTAVAGTASTRALPIAVEDTAELTLTHENGAHSVFYATLAHAANEPITVDIVTEKARLSLRGDLTVTYADGRVETVAEERLATGERSYWGVSHERLITDFYLRRDDAEPFWITPGDGARLVDIIHEVYRGSYPEQSSQLTENPAPTENGVVIA
ncbi:UDP-N-acetyl-2-amino-2-deoxyglucuronate dehydrogenase [Microbacterium sp. W4I4]|uniref:Gfo/Idh/MocA family protein n=1 Tax=Microbacterium sp. W4I4 TaxID=3042295 RepID=UPI00278B5F5D|nr:Gfo/Idh/MocA family oxidoreductase [Microbacterium sp. W4I4]MDQ0614500.1 UDP-N-acetyl-2-amino-2-deoxyglucuronate dehydrogenase [Microbacterium sp. W4I4]